MNDMKGGGLDNLRGLKATYAVSNSNKILLGIGVLLLVLMGWCTYYVTTDPKLRARVDAKVKAEKMTTSEYAMYLKDSEYTHERQAELVAEHAKARDKFLAKETDKRLQKEGELFKQRITEVENRCYEAISYCQEIVKSALKAPSTAKFPNPFTFREVPCRADGTIYTVKTYVDAQNAFGAMLRQNILCKIEYGGSYWHTRFLKVGEQVVLDETD